MNFIDWVVLLGTVIGIAAYGAWRTRHTDHLETYLKGNRSTGWFTIGLSVAATQASLLAMFILKPPTVSECGPTSGLLTRSGDRAAHASAGRIHRSGGLGHLKG